MKKLFILMAALLCLGAYSGGAQAASLTDMQEKQNQLNAKRETVQSGVLAADKKIESLQSQQKTVIQQLEALELKMRETVEKVAEKEKQIQDKNLRISELNNEIAQLQEQIAKREELLKQRARAMQENGANVDYLEVLLGAENFGDFLERVSAVSTLMQADRDIIHEQETDKSKLETAEEQVKKELGSLQSMLTELKSLQEEQVEQKAGKDRLMKELQEQEHETSLHKMDLKEEEELLAAQSAAVQKAIDLEKSRLAELEAARKRAAEEEMKGFSAGSAPRPIISRGTFTTPANGILSSNFGQRGSERHMGVDIANAGANVPVVAAADGVVSRSYLSSSYGNVIFITHSIDGKIYTTVYAHLKERLAGTGQVVAKGQQLGIMGNTGQSTGQHLHFELHNGQWNAGKTNAVNPIGIVPF
ncbi:murein hydrolase activator EnvC family protein [Peribacillus kribbensis]|uniref:murein hydrolase activator EnvC family protein n=1 Tax=Peribacillus kribbensis TaxID=356658 RepID=UPI00041C5F5E|nr:peptidoglycan DD-metalloendopeptidase family protein [Peribacillus kribbensis]